MARAKRTRSGPHGGGGPSHPGIRGKPPNPTELDARRLWIPSPGGYQRLGRNLPGDPGFHQSGKSLAPSPETEGGHNASRVRAARAASRIPRVFARTHTMFFRTARLANSGVIG